MSSVFRLPSSLLPPEVWSLIFHEVATTTRFYDTRWDQGSIISPFDDATSSSDPYNAGDKAYTIALTNIYNLTLVCRAWYDLSKHLAYSHLVIRGMSQLERIVDILEQSQVNGRVGLGWWVTHVKLMTVAYHIDEGEPNSPTGLTRRLLALCPRLEVYLDAAPYGEDERPLDLLSSTGSFTSFSPHLRSIEWVYGGPTQEDFKRTPNLVDSIQSLRAMTILDSSSMHIPGELFTLPNLTSLDLFILPDSHIQWADIGNTWSLPSLTHLTLRTAPGIGVNVGEDTMVSLLTFFDTHGANIRVLDLNMCPGDANHGAYIVAGANNDDDTDEELEDMFDLGAVLERCPNLIDLVLSARWLWPSSAQRTLPLSLTRIGLRDTAPEGPGFSALHAAEACPVCARGGLNGPHVGAAIAPATPSPHRHPQSSFFTAMSRRHCTIDRHLRSILSLRAPSLLAICLLDSTPSMFSPSIKMSGHCSNWRTCWCTMPETRAEPLFWEVWASVCQARGMRLRGRLGDGIPVPTGIVGAPKVSIGLHAISREDADLELDFRERGVTVPIAPVSGERMVKLIQHKGLLVGIAQIVLENTWTTMSLLKILMSK